MRNRSHLHIVNILDFMESFNEREKEKVSRQNQWLDIRGVIVPRDEEKCGNEREYELLTNSGEYFSIVHEEVDRKVLERFLGSKVRIWGLVNLRRKTVSPKRIEPDRPAENTGVVIRFPGKVENVDENLLHSSLPPLSA